MSKNTPTTQDVIQTQVAGFAAENGQNYRDVQDVLNSIGGLVLGQAGDIMPSADVTEPNTVRGSGSRITEIASGGDKTEADHTRLLYSVGDSRQDAIEGRVELLRRYSEFATDVKCLKDELSRNQNRDSHPAFLGAGVSSRAYVLHHDHQEFVAILPRFSDTTALTIDHRVAGAELAKGVPHLEQMVAVSYEDGTSISERMPGTVLKDLSPQDIISITDSQLYDLAETIMVCSERGIYVDFVADAGNFLYDREAGFGIIDLSATKSQYEASRLFKKMAEALSKMGVANVVGADKTYWAESVKQIVERFTDISEAQLKATVKINK